MWVAHWAAPHSQPTTKRLRASWGKNSIIRSNNLQFRYFLSLKCSKNDIIFSVTLHFCSVWQLVGETRVSSVRCQAGHLSLCLGGADICSRSNILERTAGEREPRAASYYVLGRMPYIMHAVTVILNWMCCHHWEVSGAACHCHVLTSVERCPAHARTWCRLVAVLVTCTHTHGAQSQTLDSSSDGGPVMTIWSCKCYPIRAQWQPHTQLFVGPWNDCRVAEKGSVDGITGGSHPGWLLTIVTCGAPPPCHHACHLTGKTT